MSEWEKIRLGDVIETNTSSYAAKEGWTFVNYLDTGNITNNVVESIQKINLETEKLPSRAKRKVKYNSIVYSTVRPIQRHFGIIKKQPKNFLVSTGFTVIDVIESEINAEYLYYVLSQDTVVNSLQVVAEQSTSTYPAIKASDIENLEVDLPPIATQKKIASILRALDKKIKLNRKINKNLKEEIQLVYQKIINENKNHNLVSLADLMDYAGGSQPPASEFIFEERSGYVRFIQIRDYDNDRHITYIPISSRNKICNEHDIMIARYGASLGRICAGINGAYNVALAKVIPKQAYYKEFLRCYLSSQVFYTGLNSKGDRSAQAGFNQSDIKSFMLPLPSEQELRRFEDFASVLFEAQLNLCGENRKLAIIRDTLLPNLMTKKINTEFIDI